jgi:hypothetical protein
VIQGGAGNDTIDLTGGGTDIVKYANVLDASDVLQGFTKISGSEQDVVDLDALFDSLNGGTASAARAGRVILSDTGADVALGIDTDVVADGVANVVLLKFQSMADTTSLTIGNLATDDIKVGTL